MSESTLEKLRREVREKESKRKVEVAKRKHVERERAQQVHLIEAIYIKPLASHEPTKEEIIIFEEEKKSRELEEELELTLNFLKRTPISIVTKP
jgi:hypothetical protein